MSLLLWDHWAEDWELQEKVSFNGFEKIINVNSDVTALDIMADVYSAWVRWTAKEPRFLAAMKYSGFDAIPGGRTGATFFLINGWKLIINLRKTRVYGVLYSEDFPTAYYDNETREALYPAEVSSVVNTVFSGGGGSSISAADVWAYNNRSLTTQFPTVPTVTQIRQEMDSNSVKLGQIKALLDSIDIPTPGENASAVWNTPINTITDKTTIGGYITKMIMTIPKFLGLK